MQGTKEAQRVQGAIEVVKRLEMLDEAVGATSCRGWSVGGIRRSAIAVQNRPRSITSRCTGTEGNAIIMLRVHRRPVNSRPLYGREEVG
jgi:hypothetical protein